MRKHTDIPKDTSETRERPGKGRALWLAAAGLLVAVCVLLICVSTGADGRIYPVRINEILASNTSFPNGDGRCTDYIELYNTADHAVDLTGFQLGDVAGSSRYAFPYGTILEAHSYLVVYCDATVEAEGYAKFGISRSGGESFYLIASNGAVVDSVVTLPTDLDQAMVLLADNHWALTDALTPGKANDAAALEGNDIYNSGVSSVRITEFSAADNGYAPEQGLICDWVELHNTASDSVDISGYSLSDNVGNDKYRFPQGTVIPAGGYLVVYCSDSTEAEGIAPFGLSRLGGESVVLKDPRGMIAEIIGSPAAETLGSMALTNGTWDFTDTPTPGYENTPEGYAAFMNAIGAAPGTIRISEIMAADQYILADSYGKFSDWCELYNAGETAVNLSGWFLSDDPAQIAKWQLPDLTIQPGEYRILFLSGRDTVSGDEIHGDFSLSAGGESLLLSSYLGTAVDSVTFGESTAGYAFCFDSGEAVLTDAPTPGYPNDQEGFDAFCDANVAAGPLAIWEVMTSNDWYLPQALGKCYDWVELRNVSGQSLNLSGFSLSDDPDDPGLFALPDKTLASGQSIIIILSGDPALSTKLYSHAPITLDARRDQLLLYGNGELLDYVYLKDIPLQHSYGRCESAGGFSYMEPTPGTDNISGYRQISPAPISEVSPGVYTGEAGITVPLSSPGTIYYTLDGSDPTTHSLVYTGPIRIDETTVLRAAALEDGKMLSSIYTATFIIQEPHSIPVVSLVTDPGNLWGSAGIYKNGNLMIKEERRPANISYIGPDGSFSLDCEISLHGATTVTVFDKKSFTVRFRDNYDGPLYFDVFGDGEITTFGSLIVRASHESTYSSHMHDALMGYIASEHCDTLISQKYRYVALYLNGEYWGLYAFREQHSPEHYASYMDVPADSVEIVRYMTKKPNELREFFLFCQDYSLQSEQNYAYAKSLLDMTSFADWIIIQAYMSNVDINGNMRYYYSAADGLWRCGLVDVDLGMTGGKRAFSEVAETDHHGVVATKLMENKEFQDLLARRLAELLEGPMSDANMIATIDEMANIIRPEASWEAWRWDTPVSSWEHQVQYMRSFCDGRAQEMIDSLCMQLHFTREQREYYFGHLE